MLENGNKNMNAKFFERLYLGFEAEFFVIGKLFSLGYEAFKLPADFGFDILVTNIKKTVLQQNIKEYDPFPYALQIKSRRTDPSNYQLTSNERPTHEIDFKISNHQLSLLKENVNSYIIFVIFFLDSVENSLFNQYPLCFWLNNQAITILEEKGYFMTDPDNNDYKILRVAIKQRPTISKEEILRNLNIPEKEKEKLNSILPDRLYRNWNARDYISLLRPSRNLNEKDRLVEKMLPPIFYDLTNLGIKSAKISRSMI